MVGQGDRSKTLRISRQGTKEEDRGICYVGRSRTKMSLLSGMGKREYPTYRERGIHSKRTAHLGPGQPRWNIVSSK